MPSIIYSFFPLSLSHVPSFQVSFFMTPRYFSKLTADERILASFPMKLFLEQFNLQGKVCIVTGKILSLTII